MTHLQKSGNKYHAKSTQFQGITYHSGMEAAYAEELELRRMAKEFKSWDRQVKLDLKVNGMHITNYYMDFVINHHDGSKEYVECKGLELGEWKMKWRILEATFDEFKQHPDDKLTLVKQSSWGKPRKNWKPKVIDY